MVIKNRLDSEFWIYINYRSPRTNLKIQVKIQVPDVPDYHLKNFYYPWPVLVDAMSTVTIGYHKDMLKKINGGNRDNIKI